MQRRERIVCAALALAACGGDDDSLYGCGAIPAADVDAGRDDAGGPPPDAGDPDDPDAMLAPGTIAVVAPNGGEALIGGVAVDIAWSASPEIERVDVELLRDGASALVIAQDLDAAGPLSWTPPIELATGDTYTVRVTDAAGTATDDSDAAFSVLNWQYRRTVTATSTGLVSDFQILVELDVGSFDYDHAAVDGADLRFASAADRAGGFDLDHYVELWDPAGTSRIWVKVPEIDGTAAIHMFYGAPGVAGASDFDATFPNRFTSADLALGGVQVFDLFELEAAHTITVMPGAPLEIRARIIRIDGVIDGDGAGEGADGGPGAGSGSIEGGGGGGGHGGAGGAGARDSGEPIAPGGSPNGSATTRANALGSGGGSTDLFTGGAGGGAVTLVGHTISVAGVIEADAAGGAPTSVGGGTVRAGGGGAGGGILIDGFDVSVTGRFEARGGRGGRADPGSNQDGGGGGGGGRVKVFHARDLVNTAMFLVGGGEDGDGGDFAPGDGDAGSVHVAPATAVEPSIAVDAEQALF